MEKREFGAWARLDTRTPATRYTTANRWRWSKALAAVNLWIGLICAAAVMGPISGIGPASASVRIVPEGNRSAVQPPVPYASARRTQASRSTYETKFARVVDVLKRDRRLIGEIKRVAARYGIDPIHMIGAIVGEHTYNYDSLDSAQSYYLKAIQYAGLSIDFSFGREHVLDFTARSQFDTCRRGDTARDSNRLWTCYERIWRRQFKGRVVDGVRYPKKLFNEVFFQPLFAGQSFGLGQLTPLTVLKMSDSVHGTSGLPRLDAADSSAIYRAAMDPKVSLHYVAAVIRDGIDAYRAVAGFDISQNPGITATLYNLGDPWTRAAKLKQRNGGMAGAVLPRENYYGWLVNAEISTLRGLL